MALPPDESLSKDETVLICTSGTSCLHEHISPLLGEHPRIVNICLGPVTVHYREVSLYNEAMGKNDISQTEGDNQDCR